MVSLHTFPMCMWLFFKYYKFSWL